MTLNQNVTQYTKCICKQLQVIWKFIVSIFRSKIWRKLLNNFAEGSSIRTSSNYKKQAQFFKW